MFLLSNLNVQFNDSFNGTWKIDSEIYGIFLSPTFILQLKQLSAYFRDEHLLIWCYCKLNAMPWIILNTHIQMKWPCYFSAESFVIIIFYWHWNDSGSSNGSIKNSINQNSRPEGAVWKQLSWIGGYVFIKIQRWSE